MQKNILEQFETHFPTIAKQRSACTICDYEIIVKLMDGNTVLFDSIDNTIRFLPEDSINIPKDEYARLFGRRLRRIMQRKGLTQNALSEITGISTSNLYVYLSGKSIPSFHMVDKMANALDCSLDEFRYIY